MAPARLRQASASMGLTGVISDARTLSFFCGAVRLCCVDRSIDRREKERRKRGREREGREKREKREEIEDRVREIRGRRSRQDIGIDRRPTERDKEQARRTESGRKKERASKI